jgi:hypothetical protein
MTEKIEKLINSFWYELLVDIQWRLFQKYIVARFYLTHGIPYLAAKFFGVHDVLEFGPFFPNSEAPLALHVLTCSDHFLLCLWALASWYGIGKRQDRLCIHEDGTLLREQCEIFSRMFPGCTIVRKTDADEVAARNLHDFPNTVLFRNTHGTAMKLLDFAFFSGDEDYLLMDSDVLTLGSMEGLDTHLSAPRNLFMRDFQYAFKLDKARFEQFSRGSAYLPVNTGFGRVKRGTLDLERVEFILKTAPEIWGSPWTEQTLYALLSDTCGVSLLGPEFVVCRGFAVAGIKLKHYVGITRRLAYVEGMPLIRSILRP